MIRNTKDLSPGQKAAIESLLGRRVLEDEGIGIRIIKSPCAIGPAETRDGGTIEEVFRGSGHTP